MRNPDAWENVIDEYDRDFQPVRREGNCERCERYRTLTKVETSPGCTSFLCAACSSTIPSSTTFQPGGNYQPKENQQ